MDGGNSKNNMGKEKQIRYEKADLVHNMDFIVPDDGRMRGRPWRAAGS